MTYLIMEEVNTLRSIDIKEFRKTFSIREALFRPYCDIMQVLHTEEPNNYLVQDWIYKRAALFMEGLD